MNATRIVAPAVGGLLIGPIGMGGAFAVLTGLYALSAVFTLGMPKMPPMKRDVSVTFFSDFAGGFRYLRGNHLVLGLLLLGTIPMIFAMPYQTLLPVFAKDEWDVGSTGLGVVQGMAGVGGLAGALITANMDRTPNKGRVMLVGAMGTGFFLLAFSYSNFPTALAMTALIGMMSMIFVTVNNTVITATIPDEVRGRVSSVMMMTFGLMPLGAVPASIAAEFVGVRLVSAIGAMLLMATVAVAFLVFPQFRRLESPVRTQHPGTKEESVRPAAAAS
jgi:MFS family permease